MISVLISIIIGVFFCWIGFDAGMRIAEGEDRKLWEAITDVLMFFTSISLGLLAIIQAFL